MIVEVTPPIGPGVEKPSSISISPTLIGITVLALLIAINIYFFVFKRNKNENNQRSNPPNNGMQPPRM